MFATSGQDAAVFEGYGCCAGMVDLPQFPTEVHCHWEGYIDVHYGGGVEVWTCPRCKHENTSLGERRPC